MGSRSSKQKKQKQQQLYNNSLQQPGLNNNSGLYQDPQFAAYGANQYGFNQFAAGFYQEPYSQYRRQRHGVIEIIDLPPIPLPLSYRQ